MRLSNVASFGGYIKGRQSGTGRFTQFAILRLIQLSYSLKFRTQKVYTFDPTLSTALVGCSVAYFEIQIIRNFKSSKYFDGDILQLNFQHSLLSCREKKQIVVLICMHKVMHVLRYVNKNLIFCSFYILENCKLYLSLANQATKLFYDFNSFNQFNALQYSCKSLACQRALHHLITLHWAIRCREVYIYLIASPAQWGTIGILS